MSTKPSENRKTTRAIRRAVTGDVAAIEAVLRANADDPSLFQQSASQIRRTLGDFLVIEDEGSILGCAALCRHSDILGEILAVAVHPGAQGAGVGSTLVRAAIELAGRSGLRRIWLGTARPAYFARFGFRPISRWSLPIGLLFHKLRLALQQPPRRWLPAIFGRHRFMAITLGAALPSPAATTDPASACPPSSHRPRQSASPSSAA
jgi:amino-acid N-acetyltransferase